MENFVGEIRIFAGTFAPSGWHFCDGSSLSIAQNTVLYSLIGTTYGGSATNFNLPNLNGGLPVGQGQGPGLQNYPLGLSGGSDTVTLQTPQLPSHNHGVAASTAAATQGVTGASVTFATVSSAVHFYDDLSQTSGSSTNYSPQAIGVTGGGQAHDNTMPCMPLRYIIALTGLYPSFP